MTRFASIAGALLATTSIATAAPLDRSGQSVEDILYADGTYIEFGFSYVWPDVTGSSTTPLPTPLGVLPAGQDTGEVAESFAVPTLGMKYDVNDRISLAFIYDQPFGTDIDYPDDEAFVGAGTNATLDTQAYTALAKYRFDFGTSVFGGIRYQTLEADADVPFAGNYSIEADEDGAVGYVLGVAYERPEIALRVALTYNSEIDHSLDTSESVLTPLGPTTFESVTDVTTPQSVNLEAQTGVAPGTLVFGSIRWVDYSEFTISPEVFSSPLVAGRPLADYDNDLWFFNIGVGRAVTERLSVAGSVEYVTEERNVVSLLSPSDGRISLGLGGTYDITDDIEVGLGVRYSFLGDADAGSGDTELADFEDNNAVAVGLTLGYSF